MDTQTINNWRKKNKMTLSDIAAILFPEVIDMESKTAFDDTTNNYLVIVTGWEGVKRLHGCMIHVEIKNDKIWIHLDGTEHGIATDLVESGIRKGQIVLGFKTPESRKITEYAVA